MKSDTVEQYKVLNFIKENFYIEAITIEKIDGRTLKVTDREGDSALFRLGDDDVVSMVQSN